MYKYKAEDLSKLRKIQIEILTEIIRICDKHSIKWFTDGGTTIGAVRHKGFIPWDDDVDIAMLREDYERFLEVAPHEIKNGYTVAHFSMDSNVPFYFAKVRKNDTLFLEEPIKNLKINHGVYVDIFPYDVVPLDKKLAKIHKYRILHYHRQFSYRMISSGDKGENNKLKYLTKTIYKKFIRIFLLGFKKEYFYKKLDSEFKKYNKLSSSMVSPCIGGDFTVNKNEIFPTIKMKFENIEVEVPRNYDSILRQSFGDYMSLPPENKRLNHAPCKLKLE